MTKRLWWAAWAATILLAGWGVWHLRPAGGLASPGPPPLPAQVIGQPPAENPPVRTVQPLPRSLPYKIIIKKISLRAMIGQLGMRQDGRIETPSYDTPDRADWYRHSSTPGEAGPAVILGHVDSKDRIAVFFYLSKLRPGDQIEIVRQDRSTAIFEVMSVEQFPKNQFPTDRVYGPTAQPTLRLVTCGGKFNTTTKSYVDNVVVFATMVGSRPSPPPGR